jgi:L-malate glycosyltransferase
MSRPLRVLHTLSAITHGGVEARHLQLVRNLPPDRFEHRFIATRRGDIANHLVEAGAPVAVLGDVRSVLAPGRYLRGFRLARAWAPDVIHGAVMEGNVLGAVIGRRLGIPTIVEETSDPTNRRPMGHRLARLTGALASRCVAVSPAVRRYLVDELGLPQDKVRLVVNGVPAPAASTEAERRALRRRLGIGEHDVVIGTVCRLFDDHKRVTDLIEAFARLATDHPRARLLIVGSGPDRGLMESAAERCRFGSRVHFVGRQVPADPYYAIMDVFALVSSREAFGLVAAEAMHAGIPVVATSVGGLGEIVVDGSTGFLVHPRRPDELAGVLRKLVTDAALRQRMGDAGKARAAAEYSVERYVSQVEALYLELATEGS